MMEKSQIAQLVSKVLEGDEKAFESLYNLTNQNAYFVAKKITKDEDAALDILQDSYIKALEKLSTLSDPGAFVSWFNQIVANTSKNYLCKSKAVLFDNEEDEHAMRDWQTETDTDYLPEESLDTDETRKAIMDIIDSLPEDRRLCVLMHYFDDMPVGEIAEVLDVSEGTVKSHLFHSRKKIKETIEDLRKKGVTVLGMSAIPFFKWLLKRIGLSQTITHDTAACLFKLIKDTSVIFGGAAVVGGATVAVETGIATGIISKFVAAGIVPKIIAAVTGTAVLVTGVTVGTKVAVEKRRESESLSAESTCSVAEENKTYWFAQNDDTDSYSENINEEYSFELGITTSDGATLQVIVPQENDTSAPDAKTEKTSLHSNVGVSNTSPAVSQANTSKTQKPTTTRRSYFPEQTAATSVKETTASTTKLRTTTATEKEKTEMTKKQTTERATTTQKKTTTTQRTTTTTRPTSTTQVTTTKFVTTTEKETTTATTEAAEFTYTISGSSATVTGYTGSGSRVTIPSTLGGATVTAIDKYAFEGLDITSVSIPSTVKSIGTGAFQNCTELTSVSLPSGLTSLGNVAFKNCQSLTSVSIPSSLGSIGAGAFQGCSSLTSAYIPSSVTSIGTNAFNTGNNNLVISCSSGSAAHAYAEENGIAVNLT